MVPQFHRLSREKWSSLVYSDTDVKYIFLHSHPHCRSLPVTNQQAINSHRGAARLTRSSAFRCANLPSALPSPVCCSWWPSSCWLPASSSGGGAERPAAQPVPAFIPDPTRTAASVAISGGRTIPTDLSLPSRDPQAIGSTCPDTPTTIPTSASTWRVSPPSHLHHRHSSFWT